MRPTPLLLLLLALPCLAQDHPGGGGQGTGGGHGLGDGQGHVHGDGRGQGGANDPRDDRRAPAGPTKRLALDVPAGWTPRRPSARGFAYDYDLPAAPGDPEGARVNLLFYPVSVDHFRGRLPHRWRRADGSPHPLDAHRAAIVHQANGVTIRVVELQGTFTPREAPARPGQTLVAAHLDVPGGAWTAWLTGPSASVALAREAYLGWLKSARVEDAPADVQAGGSPGTVDPKDTPAVRDTRFVHGAPPHGVPGPWALTGWRIGADALKRLGLGRDGAWEVVVTHRAPDEVRYTCMLDGLQAATGASAGKRNLVFEAAKDEAALETVVQHRPSGRRLVYRLTPAFRDVIRPIDYDDFPAAASMLEVIPETEMWTVEEAKAP